MIQLPENWKDTIRVYPPTKSLFLHFQNDHKQYFTYYQTLDPALPLDLVLDAISKRELGQAYILKTDMTSEYQDPLDQNWLPAPLPDYDMCSLAQYKAGLANV